VIRSGIKRAIDLAASVAALAVLAPVIAVVALLVRVTLGRPVLFRQLRPGLQGRPFLLVKFRSMRSAAGAGGGVDTDGERLTSLGRRLRAWSLDELPTFWNVLRGDMSLVGPRPLLMQYLERYTPRQARRGEVKPGITGWAQVNGRNALTWEERFELDVWYVEHWSLWVDVKILALTLWAVVRRRGISHAGSATMPEFMGGEAQGR
jgi:sugar transferase EpsL